MFLPARSTVTTLSASLSAIVSLAYADSCRISICSKVLRPFRQSFDKADGGKASVALRRRSSPCPTNQSASMRAPPGPLRDCRQRSERGNPLHSRWTALIPPIELRQHKSPQSWVEAIKTICESIVDDFFCNQETDAHGLLYHDIGGVLDSPIWPRETLNALLLQRDLPGAAAVIRQG